MTPLNLDQLQKLADEAKRAFTGQPKALWSDRTYLAPKDAEALSALIEQNRALVEAVTGLSDLIREVAPEYAESTVAANARALLTTIEANHAG